MNHHNQWVHKLVVCCNHDRYTALPYGMLADTKTCADTGTAQHLGSDVCEDLHLDSTSADSSDSAHVVCIHDSNTGRSYVPWLCHAAVDVEVNADRRHTGQHVHSMSLSWDLEHTTAARSLNVCACSRIPVAQPRLQELHTGIQNRLRRSWRRDRNGRSSTTEGRLAMWVTPFICQTCLKLMLCSSLFQTARTCTAEHSLTHRENNEQG